MFTLLNLSMTTHSHEANSVISSTSTTWCGLMSYR